MQPNNIIFPPQVMYEMQHDLKGRPELVKKMKDSQRRKLTCNNMHLLDGIKCEKNTSLPILDPYTGSLDYDYISYPKRKKALPQNTILHFFAEDYTFEHIWDNLDETTMAIKDFAVRTAPDFSMWQNIPEGFNYSNLLKSRCCAAYWQQNGFPTIPTVSWGSIRSFQYCLNGLPRHSVLAVCGIGNRKKDDFALWCRAMSITEDALAPIRFLIYGEPVVIPDIHTEITFIPTQLSKFRKHE